MDRDYLLMLMEYILSLQQDEEERKPWEDRLEEPSSASSFEEVVMDYLNQQPTSGSQPAGATTPIVGSHDPENPDWYGGLQSTPPVIGWEGPWAAEHPGVPPEDFGGQTSGASNPGGYEQSDTVNEQLIAQLIADLGRPFANANTTSTTSIGGNSSITGMDPKYPGDAYMSTGGNPVGGGRSDYRGDGIRTAMSESALMQTGPSAATGDGMRHWSGPFWPGTIYSQLPRGFTPPAAGRSPAIDPDIMNQFAHALARAHARAQAEPGQNNRVPGSRAGIPIPAPPPSIQHSSDVSPLFNLNPFGGSQRIPHTSIPVRGAAPAPSRMVGLFGNSQSPQYVAPPRATQAAQAIISRFAPAPSRTSSFGAPATRVLNTSTRKLR
jgi:hypothetical protein